MTDKEVQLFILRHLEAGNTKADEHILTDVPGEQRQDKFIVALIAIENRGFLCPKYRTNDKPELWNAYVSADGRAFLRENMPDPLVEIIRRQSLRLLDVIIIAVITSAAGIVINILITLSLTGKLT